MASLTGPRCTCAACWRGRGKRPECPLHEADGHPADTLEPGQARRRDGSVVTVMATIAPRAGPERDAEGMGAARSWRPVP
jgi:hypothetical protein